MATKKKKKVLFHQDNTSWSQWWQNYMNWTSNYWPPATTDWLQTSKESFRERDLSSVMKRYQKLRRILKPKTKLFYKKGIGLLQNFTRWRILHWMDAEFTNMDAFNQCTKRKIGSGGIFCHYHRTYVSVLDIYR